jgi:hypothetical protein
MNRFDVVGTAAGIRQVVAGLKDGAGRVALGARHTRFANIMKTLFYTAWTGNTSMLAATRGGTLAEHLAPLAGASPPSGDLLGTLGAIASVTTVAGPFMPAIEAIFTAVEFGLAVRTRRKCREAVRTGRADFAERRDELRGSRRARGAAADGGMPSDGAAAGPVDNRARRREAAAVCVRHLNACDKRKRTKKAQGKALVGFLRDTVAQSGNVGGGLVTVLGRVTEVASGAIGCIGKLSPVTGLVMAAAHLGSGISQLCDARSELAAAKEQLRELKSRCGAQAAMPTAATGESNAPDKDGASSGPESLPVDLNSLYDGIRARCIDFHTKAVDQARVNRRNAGLRIAYGVLSLCTHGAMLGLGLAGLTSMAAATGGIGLVVVATVLVGLWLAFGVYKAVGQARGAQTRNAAKAAMAEWRASTDADRLGRLQNRVGDARDEHGQSRFAIAELLTEHLLAREPDNAAPDVANDAAEKRSQARKLLRQLGVSDETIFALKSCGPEARKDVVSYIRRCVAGKCVQLEQAKGPKMAETTAATALTAATAATAAAEATAATEATAAAEATEATEAIG